MEVHWHTSEIINNILILVIIFLPSCFHAEKSQDSDLNLTYLNINNKILHAQNRLCACSNSEKFRKKLLNAHVDHVLEGLVQVVADFLDFHLLCEEVFFHLMSM